MLKLTHDQRKALQWFAERGNASLFGRGDPTLLMVKRLRKMGLIFADGRDARGFTRYAITGAGRAVLKGEAH
jgi:hypothetical protein